MNKTLIFTLVSTAIVAIPALLLYDSLSSALYFISGWATGCVVGPTIGDKFKISLEKILR